MAQVDQTLQLPAGRSISSIAWSTQIHRRTRYERTYLYLRERLSTAKPGRLDELCDLARRPSEQMEGKVPGMLARQVSVDRDQNAVVVWVTFAERSDLYDYLATNEGKDDHGEGHDMADIIETFEMYDLTPVSGRLVAR